MSEIMGEVIPMTKVVDVLVYLGLVSVTEDLNNIHSVNMNYESVKVERLVTNSEGTQVIGFEGNLMLTTVKHLITREEEPLVEDDAEDQTGE